MPTYDYECDTCKKVYEVYQSFSEDALTKCPRKKKCKGKVRKVYSAPGISFKGSGFYKTDNRKSGSSSSKSSSSDSSSTSDSSSSKSSDSSSSKSSSSSDSSD